MGDDITIGVTEIVNNIEVTAQPNDQIVDISVIDNADDVTLNITPTVIEINVNKGSSYAKWGTILGVLSDQTDLKNALDLKANLVGGKVPASELPSYVDDVVEVADYAALPTTGETGKIYVTLDNNKIYRWSGSIYIEIAANNAIWGAITGTLSNQTDLQNALNAKANISGQVFTGAISATNLSGTNTGDQTLSGLGGVPDSRNLTINGTTYDLTADRSWTITAGVWGQITGTLSNQTDLQAALDAKFDDPTGNTTQYIAGDGSLVTFPVAGQSGTLVREVRNTTGATLLKGTVVYISGATGNKATVSKALATSDATSAQTFGLLQADIPNNSNGYAVCVGDIIGLDTSAITEGTQLYLSSTTAGEYTTTKQVAPAHLVYVGVVTRSHPTLGQIEVKIQNGYELDEIHDVSITSKANNQFLVYESASSLWKNKSLSTVLAGTSSQFVKGDGSLDSTSYTPTARTLTINGTAYDLSANRSWTIATHNPVGINVSNGLSIDSNQQLSLSLASSAANGALSSTDWNTFNNKVPLSRTLTINGTTYDLSANRTWTITAGISGSGTTGKIPKFTGSGTIGDSSLEEGTNYFLSSKGVFITNSSSTNNGFVVAQSSTTGNTTALQLSSESTSAFLIVGYKPGVVTGFYVKSDGSGYFAGNVGIGTTSPTGKLHLASDSDMYFKMSRASGNFASQFYRNAGAGTLSWQCILSDNSTAHDYLTIEEGNASHAASKLIMQPQGGNVGIGTTSPAEKLHIGGVGSRLSFDTTGQTSANYIGTVEDFKLSLKATRGTTSEIKIGNENLEFFTNTSERMRITSGGNVGIGTTTPSYQLQLSTDSAAKPTTALWTIASDARIKENINSYTKGLNELLKINPVTYDYNGLGGFKKGKGGVGIIAQEIAEILPDSVSSIKGKLNETDEEEIDILNFNGHELTYILINAVKELKAEIELLKAK